MPRPLRASDEVQHLDGVPVVLNGGRRVLKPDGSFHFVEHGHAPDHRVAEWQRRLEPLNKRLAGGCHLTRRIPESIANSGFTLDQLDTYYFKGEPQPWGYTFEGRATKRL